MTTSTSTTVTTTPTARTATTIANATEQNPPDEDQNRGRLLQDRPHNHVGGSANHHSLRDCDGDDENCCIGKKEEEKQEQKQKEKTTQREVGVAVDARVPATAAEPALPADNNNNPLHRPYDEKSVTRFQFPGPVLTATTTNSDTATPQMWSSPRSVRTIPSSTSSFFVFQKWGLPAVAAAKTTSTSISTATTASNASRRMEIDRDLLPSGSGTPNQAPPAFFDPRRSSNNRNTVREHNATRSDPPSEKLDEFDALWNELGDDGDSDQDYDDGPLSGVLSPSRIRRCKPESKTSPELVPICPGGPDHRFCDDDEDTESVEFRTQFAIATSFWERDCDDDDDNDDDTTILFESVDSSETSSHDRKHDEAKRDYHLYKQEEDHDDRPHDEVDDSVWNEKHNVMVANAAALAGSSSGAKHSLERQGRALESHHEDGGKARNHSGSGREEDDEEDDFRLRIRLPTKSFSRCWNPYGSDDDDCDTTAGVITGCWKEYGRAKQASAVAAAAAGGSETPSLVLRTVEEGRGKKGGSSSPVPLPPEYKRSMAVRGEDHGTENVHDYDNKSLHHVLDELEATSVEYERERERICLWMTIAVSLVVGVLVLVLLCTTWYTFAFL
eukprot:jgi/Psemu1/286272/fgenesh1_pg.128_\